MPSSFSPAESTGFATAPCTWSPGRNQSGVFCQRTDALQAWLDAVNILRGRFAAKGVRGKSERRTSPSRKASISGPLVEPEIKELFRCVDGTPALKQYAESKYLLSADHANFAIFIQADFSSSSAREAAEASASASYLPKFRASEAARTSEVSGMASASVTDSDGLNIAVTL